MNIAEFSIRKSRFVSVFLIILLLAGLISYFRLGRLELPEFTIQTAIIMTVYPGATPDEVERYVTDIIENTVQELDSLKDVRSYSANDVSVVFVDIQESVDASDMDAVWYQMRKKVGDIRHQLPEEIRGPFFNDEYGDVFGIILALTGDDFSYAELEQYMKDIRREFLKIDSVAKADKIGIKDRKIYVELSTYELSKYQLTYKEIIGILKAKNVIFPTGRMSQNNEWYKLQVKGYFTDLNDIKNIEITTLKNKSIIRLKDIANVIYDYDDNPTMLMRFNGKKAVGIGLKIVDGGNVILHGDDVTNLVHNLNAQLPVGLNLDFVNFQPDIVSDSVNEFIVNLVQAVLIVLIVLLALGLKTSILVGSSVPMTILITFFVMYLFNINLQKVSLAALIIALGMLVDNAVVVIELIMVKLDEGIEKLQACKEAVSETYLPLLSATLIACAGFAAIPFAQSQAGEFCQSLFYVITISLIISWLLSVTVNPLMSYALLKSPKKTNTNPTDNTNTSNRDNSSNNSNPSTKDNLNENDKSADNCSPSNRDNSSNNSNPSTKDNLNENDKSADNCSSSNRDNSSNNSNPSTKDNLNENDNSTQNVNPYQNSSSNLTSNSHNIPDVKTKSVSTKILSNESDSNDKVPSANSMYDTKFYNTYKFFLEYLASKKVLFYSIITGLFIFSIFLFAFIPKVFFPDHDFPAVTIDFWLPAGITIDYLEEQVIEFEKDLIRFKSEDMGISHFASYIGQSAPRFYLPLTPKLPNENYAQIYIEFEDYAKAQEMREFLYDFIHNNYPDVNSRIEYLPMGPSSEFPVEFRIYGDSPVKLRYYSDKIEEIIKRHPNAVDIKSNWLTKTKKIVIDVNQTKANQIGITNYDIALSLFGTMQGITVSYFREFDKMVPIVLRASETERFDIKRLDNLHITSSITGLKVPLTQIAEINFVWQEPKIWRRNNERCISVGCATFGALPSEVLEDILPAVQKINFSDGYRFEVGGLEEKSIESAQSLARPLPVIFLVIFILLIAQFNSIRKTFIILIAVLLGIIGAIFALFVFRQPFGFMALLGVLSLSGMIIKNAIVLIDKITMEIGSGKDVYDAVVFSSVTRVRPILLAAFTTILGMMPLALTGGPLWEAMALAIMGGLSFATLLTLFFVPILYISLFK